MARVKRKHSPTCAHCANVNEYRLTRYAAEQQRENETAGYKTEMKEYGPLITYKDWLVGSSKRGSSWGEQRPS